MKKNILNIKISFFTLAIASIFSIYCDSFAQVAFNFGQSGGSISTNNSSGTNPSIFDRYPTVPTNIRFFYGFSSNANSTLKGSNVGLLRIGDSTEAQASAGNGANEFTKFGILRYSAQGTLFSYTKFDAVFAGDSLANSTSTTGTWYFFVGDGGATDQFMSNNTLSYNILQCGVSLRWTYTSNGGLTFAYYDNTTSGWVDITSITWEQKKKYSIEIYSNVNKMSANSYIRQGNSISLASKKMDIWVNNVKIASSINVSQFDNQTNNFKKMDSFCWYGTGSNNAWIFVDNVNCYDTPLTTFAYYTKKPANGTTLDLSVLSNWTNKWDGSAGTSPASFNSNYTTWFVRNYTGTTGVTFTQSSDIDISGGFDCSVIIGDSGQTAQVTIPTGKCIFGDLDVMAFGDLIIQSSIPPRIRTAGVNSTVEYDNGDANIAYPLYYNLKILSGTKTLTLDFIVDNLTTVGNGSNSATLIIPSNHTMNGSIDVTNNAKLTIQNTTYPTLRTLNTGSTVEYCLSGKSIQTTQANASFANLTINNSGGVVLGGNNTVNGTLSMTSGNLSLNGFTLTLNGTISGNGGTLTGSSASNLTIGGNGELGTIAFTEGNRILNNFTFNRLSSGSATLASYLNVVGTLTLTNGVINCSTSADSVTLGTNSSSPGTLSFSQIGPNYTSWINGKLQRFIPSGAGTIIFPIGTNSNWEGVKLIYGSNTITGGSLSAKFTLGDPGNLNTGNLDDNGYTIDRYSNYGCWTIKNSGVTGTYEINLDAYNFPGINNEPGDAKRQNLRIIKRNDSSSPWCVDGSHSAGNGNSAQWTVKRSGLTSFSDFTLGSNANDNTLGNSPLPVSLQSFTYSINGRDVNLIWKTNSEINNSGFEIQRAEISNSSPVYTKIGFVKGAGNSSTMNNYSFTDSKLNSGKFKYRLKQIDNNGNFEYHYLNNQIEISLPTKFELSQNYPNPFNPVTKIDFTLPEESKVQITIYDITGREIKTLLYDTKGAGYHTASFNAANLSSGIYIYRIFAKSIKSEYSSIRKMTLLK